MGESSLRQVGPLIISYLNFDFVRKLIFFSFFLFRGINPAENRAVAFLAMGEGWHNYHHVFPWDYKTAELGNYTLNFTTAFIDFFAWLGLAYDRKTVPKKMVCDRVLRTGDGSHSEIQKVDKIND